MKRFLGIFFALFIPVAGICAITYYSDTEQKYYFGPDAVKSTLEQFVDKEETRIACAELYTSLMNQENGQVSVTDLFAVCRKAGFNTYRKDGFDKCREFVNGLLASTETGDIDEMMSGFCPGPDEKGNNPNALKSITEKTQIGDFCSSTNIAGGEVVFRKGYNCTCAAYACNPGFQSEKGACVTEYKDANGDCLRKEYTNMTNITKAEEALKFCESNAVNGCKVRNAIRNFGGVTGRLVCNATRDEVDNAKARMLLNHEKKVAGLKYYAVCQKGVKVPSGAHAHCVEKVFGSVNVGMVEGDGLAKLYAKEKDGKTIYCSTNPPRKHSNEDYLQCATMDGKDFYEFQFDDLSESNDKNGGILVFTHDKLEGVVNGLSIIYGGQVAGKYSLNGSCQSSTNKRIVNAARNFGLVSTNTSNGKNCKFSYNTIEDESKLATIDGIDNYVFYHEIQIQGSDATRLKLEKYIRGLGIKVTSFECDTGYGKIAKKIMLGLKEKDDVWRCNLNGQPIDFVFDDTSEAVKTTQEAGEAGIMCIISQGIYANKKCHGLDQVQCTQVDAKLKSENPKSSGTKWQNGQCVLLDVQEQNRLDNGIQIGLSVIALADCATVIVGNAQGVMGCTLAVVEITGLTTELTTGAVMDKRAQEFLAQSSKCKTHSCALTTIRDMATKAVSIKDALRSASTANAIDTEMARLIDLLEPEDLQSECKGDCNYQELIAALGGDPDDASGTALRIANKVGFIAQFASLGTSAYRLTGKAIARLGLKASKQTANIATDVAKIANKADDVADVAKVTNKADDVTDAVWDATAKRFRDPKTGRFVSGYTSYDNELAALGIKRTVVDGKDVYTDIKTGKTLSETQVLNKIPTSMNDDFAKIGVRQVEQSDGTIRYLDTRPGGGGKFISEAEVLKRIDEMPATATKVADDVADATKGASSGARTATVATTTATATKQADAASDVAKTANKVANASDAASVSAEQARIANFALLRKQASSNFDAYLAEVKNSKTGLGNKLPKERLTAEGWNELNRSLAAENVQMVDTGTGYMQFVRANHIDDVKIMSEPLDARKLVVSDGSGKLYIRNSAQEMLGTPVNGEKALEQVDQMYGTIRRGIQYPVNDNKVSRAIQAMEYPADKAVKYGAPTPSYDWHIHRYVGYVDAGTPPIQYHVSLNVEVDDTIIKKLDDLIAKDQGRHIVDFKIPPKGNRWVTMADPISIYMRETSPEIERAIAEIAHPYVRTSSEIGLLGRKIDNGVAIAFETSGARMDIVEDIINQVARKDAGVAAKLRAEGRYSVGNTEALRLWASDFLGYVIPAAVP